MQEDKLECMPRAELEKLQVQRLSDMLQNLQKKVPFYANALREQNINPLLLRELKDLSELPFTSKTDLRDMYPDGMLAVPKSEIRRYHASSGTRGKPTLVAYTQADLDNWAKLGARTLRAAGVRPGDIVHNAYGYGLFTGGLGLHAAIEKHGAICVPASGGKSQQQITLLKDLAARVLCSTPSYAMQLAGTMHEMGLKANDLSLEIGIFGAEPWTEPMRQRIEQELRIKALDIYGLSEIMGPGVSIECIQARNGLHIWEDHFLVEIIDPKTLRQLPDGEEGELVITTLQKEAMPLLRYRTGDLTTLCREECSCGRTMTRMTRVRARIDDMLIIRGVNVYPSEIENILLQVDELAPHYQLVLKRDKTLDEMSVQVEVTEELCSRWAQIEDDEIRLAELTQKIRHILKESLGLSVNVELMPANSIKRSEGKACRLVDLRN